MSWIMKLTILLYDTDARVFFLALALKQWNITNRICCFLRFRSNHYARKIHTWTNLILSRIRFICLEFYFFHFFNHMLNAHAFAYHHINSNYWHLGRYSDLIIKIFIFWTKIHCHCQEARKVCSTHALIKTEQNTLK